MRAGGKPIRSFDKGHTHVVTCVVASTNGGLVLSGSLDGSVIEWDVGSGRVLGAPFILSSGANVANTKKDLPSSPITSMALAEDAEAPVLYTAAKASRGSTSGVVREWNLHRRVQTRVFNVEAEVPWGVCVARGLLFVACNDSCTRMWSTRGSSRMCDVPGACTVS